MSIPFLDLSRKTRADAGSLREAFERVLAAKAYILGEECAAFERELGLDLGVPAERVVSCNSGTDALILAMKVMGVGPGNEVVVPAHTAVPTVAAIRSLHATPRFADVDPETWVLDVKDALKLVSGKTRAIIGVHLYGNAVDLTALESVRELVLEDVAQAQGGSMAGVALGAWGRAGAFSFYPTKNLGALGDGGAVVFRSEADAGAARMLRFYGQRNRNFADLDGGINSRLDELQAAFLRARLRTYRAELERKDALRARYLLALDGLPLRTQRVTEEASPAWHLFVIATEDSARREAVQAALEEAGIGCLVHYPVPNHRQSAFSRFAERALPVTDKLCDRILSLPLHSQMTDADVDKVSDAVRKALR